MAITKIPAAGFSNAVNFRNTIINGDMSIAQRATSSTGITGSGYYTCDRWRIGADTAGTWTQSQDTSVPTGQGFAKSIKLDCTTANGSLSAGSVLFYTQRIEGQNLQYLKKGTSNAESLTASFWVKSNKTGTYILMLDDTDNGRSFSKSYTISSANTWEKKTLTYAGDTSGAFSNDNNRSFDMRFWLAAGGDFTSGTLNTSWNSNTNANMAVGQVNLADSTSNELYLTGIQLEVGTTASEFEFLPVDINLGRCQRYFCDSGTSGVGWVAGALNASNAPWRFQFPKTMRAAPSGSIIGTINTDYKIYQNEDFRTMSNAYFGAITLDSAKVEVESSAAFASGEVGHWYFTTTTGKFQFSAEL